MVPDYPPIFPVARGVADAVQSFRCQLLGDGPYTLGSLAAATPSIRPALANTLNAIRRLTGCPPLGDITLPTPPYEGGQCEGVVYKVYLAGEPFPAGNPGTADREGIGPVSGLCFPDAGFGNTFIGVQFANGCEFRGGGQTFAGPGTQDTWRITSIERLDGEPDTCGDPPPEYPPPVNINTNLDVTFEGDEGDVTLNIPFTFSPIVVNFDGTLSIPFNFTIDGVNLTGNFPLNVNAPITINPPRLPPGSGEDFTPIDSDNNPPTSDPPPGGGDDPGSGGSGGNQDPIEPAPPDQKIIGVVVSAILSNNDRVSEIASPGIPPIYAPRLGSVKFAYRLGPSTFWSSDLDIKDRRTFIPCPFSQGADAVVASPQPGVNMTFVPIRGFPLATTADVIKNS